MSRLLGGFDEPSPAGSQIVLTAAQHCFRTGGSDNREAAILAMRILRDSVALLPQAPAVLVSEAVPEHVAAAVEQLDTPAQPEGTWGQCPPRHKMHAQHTLGAWGVPLSVDTGFLTGAQVPPCCWQQPRSCWQI